MKNLLKVSFIALAFTAFTTSCGERVETTDSEVTETSTDMTEGEIINRDEQAAENATADQDTVVLDRTENVTTETR